MTRDQIARRRIRPLLIVFMLGLVISGLTAIPLESEVRVVADLLDVDAAVASGTASSTQRWIHQVRDGLMATNANYPFIAYGTDWLAFGHLMIALVFLGPLIDPWRNEWVVTFGIIACVAVVPMALVAGGFRGIPWGWRALDSAFGMVGILPLLAVRGYLRRGTASGESQTPTAM